VKVFLNVPGEGRQGFTFDPDIRVLPGWGGNNLVLARPRFTPDPGVTSTLGTGTSSYLQVNERGELYAPGGIPYNPASPDFGGAYVLTTLNGTRYRIDGATGLLESAQTRSGVGLQFSSDAIASSSGTRITIARDQSNRITSITDTANQTIEYRYQNDDLLEVIDRDGNSTQFAYSPTRDHYLESIIDPFGRVGVRQEYDDRGRLIAVIDSNGNRTEFNFDTDVSTNTIRDPLGRETRLVYDNRGNILLEIDPLGDATEYEYDSFGNETSITDPLGNTQRFDYRSDGQLTATTDPSGQVTRYQYGSSGDVTAVVNALGQISLSGINSNGGVESITNAAGSTIDFELNSLGVPTSIQFNDGLRIQTTYDSEGREVSTVDPVGNLVSFERDSRGNLTGQVIEYEDSDGQIRRIEASSLYNADGLLLESVDPLGNVLKNLYDAAGRLVERRLPNNRTEQRSYNSSGQLSGLIFGDGASVRYAYDPVGNVVEITDESGRTTRFEYDDANRVIREIYPDASPEDISDNPAVAYEYNSAGRVTAAIDENGERTEFEYDSRGLQSLVRDPLGNEIRFEYDALGRRTALVDELDRRTEIAYDAIGNPIAATFPDGTNETATFDNFGNRTSVTNALGRTTRFEYDAVGRLIRTVNPLGHATSYSHDSLGNLTEITDANGNVTSFEYDDIGRRIGETLPLGQRLTIEYDEIGQPISYVDQNGNEFGLEYDERGRLVKRTFANDPDITYSYTPTGQLASVTNGTGTATYEYDERDRIVRQVDVNGAIVEYAYDPAGYLTSLSVDGSTTTYEHDEAGRLVSVASPDGQATTYGYDDAGQLILETKPNGVETLFDRDLRDRILSVVHRDNEANILASFEYTYDAIGQRTQVVDSDGDTVVWSYDQLNRLVSEVRSNAVDSVSLTFTYDAVGNRLSQVHSQLGSTTYQYDSNDRLIQKFSAEGTTDYRYDENGNLIEQIGTDGSRRELTWDDMNQLVAIAEVENGSTTNYQYTFDSAGRRIEEQSDGEVKQFVWADIGGIDEVVRETTESETSEYVFGLNRISQATDGQTYYFGSDAHSGTRILTDAAGIAVQQYSYDAFGNLVESPATPVTSYLYRGQYRGPDGLDYLKVRHLDPTDGRFLSRDPFNGVPSDPGTLVDYVYAGNNPVNASDPSGAATLPDLSAALTVGKIINAALFAFFVGVKTASSVKAGTFSAGKFFEIVAFEAAFAAAGFGIGRVGGAAIAKALVPATKSSAFQAAARQLGGFHAVMRAGINSPKSYAAFNALAHAINQKATVVGSKVAQGLLKNLPSTIRVTGKRGLEQVTVTVFSYPGLQASKKGVEEAAKATLRKAGIKFGEESLKVVFVSSTKVPSANLPQLVGLLSQMLFTASEVGFHVLFGLQLDVPKDE
jgi:RHS repeat-associated protein